VAVQDWVTYYGAILNINPTLTPFRLVRCGGPREEPMTSVERELRGPFRPALVRERLLEHFASEFGFVRTTLFFDHPLLTRKAPRMLSLPLLEVRKSRSARLRRADCPIGSSATCRAATRTFFTQHLLDELRLETVCENARCPNRRSATPAAPRRS